MAVNTVQAFTSSRGTVFRTWLEAAKDDTTEAVALLGGRVNKFRNVGTKEVARELVEACQETIKALETEFGH